MWLELTLVRSVSTLPVILCCTYLPPGNPTATNGMCGEDDACPRQRQQECNKIHVKAAIAAIGARAELLSRRAVVIIGGDTNSDARERGLVSTTVAQRRFNQLQPLWMGTAAALRWMNGSVRDGEGRTLVTRPSARTISGGTTIDHLYVSGRQHGDARRAAVLGRAVMSHDAVAFAVHPSLMVSDHYPVSTVVYFPGDVDQHGVAAAAAAALPPLPAAVPECVRGADVAVVADTVQRVTKLPRRGAAGEADRADFAAVLRSARAAHDDGVEPRVLQQRLSAEVAARRLAAAAIAVAAASAGAAGAQQDGAPVDVAADVPPIDIVPQQWRLRLYATLRAAATALGMYSKPPRYTSAGSLVDASLDGLWRAVIETQRELQLVERRLRARDEIVRQSAQRGAPVLFDDVLVHMHSWLQKLLLVRRDAHRDATRASVRSALLDRNEDFQAALAAGDARRIGSILSSAAPGGPWRWVQANTPSDGAGAATEVLQLGGGADSLPVRERAVRALAVLAAFLHKQHNSGIASADHAALCASEQHNAQLEASLRHGGNDGAALVVVPLLDSPFTAAEVVRAIARLRVAAGALGVPADLVRLESQLQEFGGADAFAAGVLEWGIQHEWLHAAPAVDLCVTRATPSFKSGDASDPANYRLICVSELIAKVVQAIVTARLEEHLAPTLHTSQCGFRPGRGTMEAVLARDQVTHMQLRDGRPVYSCFFDIRKCFPSIQHHLLLHELAKRGVRGRLWLFLKAWLSQACMAVEVMGMRSPIFRTSIGLAEGTLWCPLLSLVMLDPLLRTIDAIPRFVPGAGVRLWTPPPPRAGAADARSALAGMYRRDRDGDDAAADALPHVLGQQPVAVDAVGDGEPQQPGHHDDGDAGPPPVAVFAERVRAILCHFSDDVPLPVPQQPAGSANDGGAVVSCRAYCDDIEASSESFVGLQMQVYAAGVFAHRYCLQFNVSSAEKTAWMLTAPRAVPSAAALARLSQAHRASWRELGSLFDAVLDASAAAHPGADSDVAATVVEWRPKPATLVELSLPSWSGADVTASLQPAIATWRPVPHTRRYRYLGVTVDDSGPSYLGSRVHRAAAVAVFRTKSQQIAQSPTKHYPPWFVSTVYNTHVRQPTLYGAAAWMCDGVPASLGYAEEAVLRQLARVPSGVTLSAPLLRSACGIKSLAYGVHVQLVGHLLSLLKQPVTNDARRVLTAEVRQWQHHRGLVDTHDANVRRWRALGSVGQPPQPLTSPMQCAQMASVWWSHVYALLQRVTAALEWMVSERRPPSLHAPAYDVRGIAEWHSVVEALASGSVPLRIVGQPEASMVVKLLSGDQAAVTASNLVLRLASGYKAALYALEVHDRVAAVLKSTAISDVRRWVWHPATTPLHRCNNGEAVALRTRCRMGLAAAIGINWYEKLMDDDRKSCVLCGLRDSDVVQPSAAARQDDEVTRSAAPQRAFCVTHVFGECARLEDARQQCWETLRRMAVEAGVHSKAHIDVADRTLWLDFIMGAPVPARFMAVGTHTWMRWYTNVSADKVGTAPKLHPAYFKLMTAAAPFLKLVVQRVHAAIVARRGAPPGVQYPPLPRPLSVRRPLPVGVQPGALLVPDPAVQVLPVPMAVPVQVAHHAAAALAAPALPLPVAPQGLRLLVQ
jgi:hypothetical protein